MKLFILLVLFLGIGISAYSQPGNPLNPTPLDGGLSLLIAGGAAFGYRVYRNKRSNLHQ